MYLLCGVNKTKQYLATAQCQAAVSSSLPRILLIVRHIHVAPFVGKTFQQPGECCPKNGQQLELPCIILPAG